MNKTALGLLFVLPLLLPTLTHGTAPLGGLPLAFGSRPLFGHSLGLLKTLHNTPVADDTASSSTPSANYTTSKLDHFDFSNSATFQQRFFVNTTYSNGGGLHFLYVEGEYPAVPDHVSNEDYPHMQLAKDQQATVWALEHRFYGKSQPFE